MGFLHSTKIYIYKKKVNLIETTINNNDNKMYNNKDKYCEFKNIRIQLNLGLKRDLLIQLEST